MTIEEAIKKAIDGGYNPVQTVGCAFMTKNIWGQQEKFSRTWEEEKTEAIVLLDPLFWQALGGSLGWYAGEFKQRALDLMEAVVAEGKTPESFFETLQ